MVSPIYVQSTAFWVGYMSIPKAKVRFMGELCNHTIYGYVSRYYQYEYKTTGDT